MAWLLAEAERHPVLTAWEDLHWADPSTLEVLGLVLEQTPTVPMLHVLTFRPEFEEPWPRRSHMTPITLNRLERPQIEALITHRAGGKTLPAEVVSHIVTKTDGVPLYVEELTKMLLDSSLLRVDGDLSLATATEAPRDSERRCTPRPSRSRPTASICSTTSVSSGHSGSCLRAQQAARRSASR